MSAVAHWLERYNARRDTLPGAGVPWLDALREEGIMRFADEGWPGNRLEDWRHTSLALLEERSFASAAAPLAPETVLQRLRDGDAGVGGHWLVFVDGRHAPALSELGRLPAGAEIRALAEVLETRPDSVEAHFGAVAEGSSPAALNAALATDGAFVHLARGVALDAPLHLVFIGGVHEGASQVRNLIVAEAGAEATLVEHYVGGGGAGDVRSGAAVPGGSGSFTNAVTRISAAQDARITHLKLQEEDPGAVHVARIAAVQARGSVFASHSLSFGAQLARNDIATRFDGEGCEALLNGLFHVAGRSHVDHHTRIEHAQPRGTSREFYRGVLDGAGRGVFAGRILVAPGAVGTDAMQRADNLILSPQAEADARPELEIYADDVKCAHGATVGQIDEDSLFYLRTRGLDETHARNLLTYAFAAEVLARVGVEPLKRRAQAVIRARLPGGELMETLS